MNIKYIYVFLAALALAIMPAYALAIDPALNPIGSIGDSGEWAPEYSFDTIPTTLVNLVNWFAWFTAVVSVAMGLYAGFLFITARGETAQLSTARKTVTYAVIGIVVALLSFSIIAITKAFL